MKKILKIILFTLLSNISFADSFDDLTWFAQDYPPYSYIGNSNKNKGPLIELVGEIMQKAGSSKSIDDIQIRTFSKMFMYSNNNQNAVFFPLARTPDRDSYFKWVGPIFINKPVVYAKANVRSTDKGLSARKPIIINQIDDLKNYSIAGRDKYTGVMQLQNAGVSVQTGDSDEDNFISLKNDQVQMIVCDNQVGEYLIKKLGEVASDYQIVYKLDENEMNFAFNKDTDDDLIKQVQDILKTTTMKELK